MAVTAGSLCDLDLAGVSEALAARARLLGGGDRGLSRAHRAARRRAPVLHHGDARQPPAPAPAPPTPSRQRGERRGPLHGVPIALKDLIAVGGVPMTAGSEVLADHVPAATPSSPSACTPPAP